MDNLIIYQEPSYKLTPMVLLLAFLLIWCIRWRRCWNKEIRSLGESYKHDALTVLLLTHRELRGGVRIWVCNTIQYFMSYIHSVDVRHFCLSVARRYSSYNYNKKKNIFLAQLQLTVTERNFSNSRQFTNHGLFSNSKNTRKISQPFSQMLFSSVNNSLLKT